ncbi:MAG: tetratricopeptide repeat protein [Bacteroidetes bacterium]|nr:tetratricopeptide repeat protein [Bacteroidota bacterium]
MKKVIQLFLFFIASCTCSVSHAQKDKIDSLQNLIAATKIDSTKAKYYLQLSNEYVDADNAMNGKMNAELAYRLYRAANVKSGIYESAFSLGNIFLDLGDYTKALEMKFVALNVADSMQSQKKTSLCYNSIGIIYWYQNNNTKALEYYKKALAIQQQQKDSTGISGSLNNIGIVYKVLGDTSTALKYYKQALEYENPRTNKKGISNTFNNLGTLYQSEKDYDRALKYYLLSLDLRREINNRIGVSTSLANIGALYLEMKDLPKAEQYELEALGISKEIGDLVGVEEICETLSEVYSKKNDGMKALKFYKEFIKARDSLNNEETKRSMERIEMQNQYENEKLALRKDHEKQSAIDESEKKKQKLIILAVTAGLVMVLLFLGFILNRFRITQRQKMIIEKQKIIVEEKNKSITDSINYAERIQSALLTQKETWEEIVPEYFILFKPRDVVSGDFYWAYSSNAYAVWCAADCTGHGVPGAFMSVLGMSFLDEIVSGKKIFSTGLILNLLREKIIHALEQRGREIRQRDGMDISIFSWNKKNNTIEFSGANNPAVIIRKSVAGNEVIFLEADKMPVGVHSGDLKDFGKRDFQLQKGDALYCFTDGYADQFGGEKGKKFKYKQLEEKLLAVSAMKMSEQKNVLDKTFEDWKGNLEQLDDVCVIGIRI